MLMDAPIETPRLILRTLRSPDVGEEYMAWLSDPEVTRYLEIRFTVQTIQGAREFISAMNASEDSLFLGMFLKSSATHIGNIKLGPMDWHHRRGDIGLVIGDGVHWGKGFATEAINKPGLAIRGLEPWSLVDVQTANTLYHLTILDPYESLILIQGGRHFADVTEARLSGSSFGGSLLKLHFIGCGMHLEVTTDDMKVVTSQVHSVTVRDSDLPGPF